MIYTQKQHSSTLYRSGLALHLICHFSPFNCCLSVSLQLDKEDYPENVHVVFCPNTNRSCSFEPYICLDLVLECQQSFLFQICSCLMSFSILFEDLSLTDTHKWHTEACERDFCLETDSFFVSVCLTTSSFFSIIPHVVSRHFEYMPLLA